MAARIIRQQRVHETHTMSTSGAHCVGLVQEEGTGALWRRRGGRVGTGTVLTSTGTTQHWRMHETHITSTCGARYKGLARAQAWWSGGTAGGLSRVRFCRCVSHGSDGGGDNGGDGSCGGGGDSEESVDKVEGDGEVKVGVDEGERRV
jgi:hypothetical protein